MPNISKFKYNTIFSAQIEAVDSIDISSKEIKASIESLKDLMPPYIDLDEDPAILYVVGNLAVADLVNLNDDCITAEDTIKVYKKFERQQCNIEHNREKVVGYILKCGLSEKGTDRIISEQEALESGKPFNIATVAAIWRVVNPELCDFILEASSPLSPNYKKLSLSFEVGFNEQKIALVPSETRNVKDAKIIYSEGTSEYDDLLKKSRKNGGSGIENGLIIANVCCGDIIPLGQGIVGMPAADVKGIIAVIKEESILDDENLTECEVEESASLILDFKNELSQFLKKISSNIKNVKNSVSANISLNKQVNQFENIMTLEKELNEIVAKVNAAEKLEDVKELFANDAVSAIARKIAEYSEQAAKAEKEKADLELANQEAVAQLEKDSASLAEANKNLLSEKEALETELNEIKAKEAAAQAEQAFQERVAHFTEEYDLDDETRALVIEDIKDLDEEAFAKYKEKSKVVMKEKSKKYKNEKDKISKDKMDEVKSALEKAGIKVKLSEDNTLDFSEILASAKNDVIDSDIENNIEAAKTLQDQMVAAFGGKNTTIGGKTIEEIQASKKKGK